MSYTPAEYRAARTEYAWMLAAEGLRTREIRIRLGCSTNGQVRYMIYSFGEIMQQATMFTTIRVHLCPRSSSSPTTLPTTP